ncbi:MAG: HNH endonuclease family protein [Candidatus Methylophosphatis roskildensis]
MSTLTMLFAVLRAVMPDAADDITDFLYKKGKVSLGETNEYRLIAREEDADFFRSFVQEPGGIARLVASPDRLEDSRLRFRENAALLLEKATALPSAERDALWKFLANDCSPVVISTPDLEAAYRIFSVLNNRGLDLAPINIIKAAVLGSIRTIAGDAKSRFYAKEWSRVESTLGRDAFGDLFVHIRTIYAKQKQRATLVLEFQDHVTEYRMPIDLVDKVIKPYAEVWDFVRDADSEATELAESINDRLSWLNRVDFKDWVPPALVYFKRFRQQPKLLADFFKALERLTYFLLVTKVGINERIETYADLTKEIEPDAFDGDLLALKALALTDKQKREFLAALDGDIYRRLPKARMALMLRLEALVSDGSKKQAFDHLSLEHVLPQTPPAATEWVKWFPDEDERDAWTHRLANLVPLHLRKNPAASNYDFGTKKNVYFKGKGTASPFILTQEVRSEDSWTPAMLVDQQKRLVGVLEKHWELEVPPTESVSKTADTTTGPKQPEVGYRLHLEHRR